MASVIPALVLAAGRSSRMGRPKANLPVDDRDTFLSRIVRTFGEAGVDDVVVVLGHDAGVVAASLAATGLGARLVLNPEYDRGQLSSLRAGLTVIDRPGVAAILVTLVDVPLISPSTVQTVVEHYRRTHAPIVRPVNGDRHGHPLVIDRRLFEALRRGDDAQGAKPIVRAHASSLGDVEIQDEGAFVDIDTMEEYRRLLSRPFPVDSRLSR